MIKNQPSPPLKCSHGFLLSEMAKGNVRCKICLDSVIGVLAKRTVLGHIWAGLVEIFNFNFICAFGSFIWAYMRLFKKGDYDPNGKDSNNFYVLGLLKK